MNMEKLSVVIITFNEEGNIARCINSVKTIADEIIVLDSFSSDKTVAIARAHSAIVFQEKFKGYIEQKNRAAELASHNYILSLDADEVADETLVKALSDARKTFTFSAYRMKRCTNHCGRFIRKGAWYPDRKIRLFDKRVAKWGGLNPHDKIVLKKTVAVKQLPGEILHFSYATMEEHIAQHERFSTIVAQSYHQAGRRTNLVRVVMNPLWAFLYDYLLRRGFVNGKQGWQIAIQQFRYTYLKHLKLYKLQSSSPVEVSTKVQQLQGGIS